MNSLLVISSIFTLTGLLFSGSSGILLKSYASINNDLPNNFNELYKQELLVEDFDKSQIIQAGEYLIDGLKSDKINEEWLRSNGLVEDLFHGVDKQQLIDDIQKLIDGFSKGSLEEPRLDLNDVSERQLLIFLLIISTIFVFVGCDDSDLPFCNQLE